MATKGDGSNINDCLISDGREKDSLSQENHYNRRDHQERREENDHLREKTLNK